MPAVAKVMPWKKLANAAPPPAEIDPVALKIDELGKIKAELSPLKKREKVLVKDIGDLGAGQHRGTKCLAVVTVEDDGEKFDAAAFKEAHPELAAQFMKPSSVTKVVIKPLI